MEPQQSYVHSVKINWDKVNLSSNTVWWNEIYIEILELFGLPGHKYYYHPSFDHAEFLFKHEIDATMCRLLLSEYL